MGNSNSVSQQKVIVIVSGFFDPVGIQHLILFEEAKKLGDYLIAGVNSDECGLRKKGQPPFMPFFDRKYICERFNMIDEVVGFNDADGSASLLIRDVYNRYKDEVDAGKVKIIFANGGDRAPGQDECPEVKYVNSNGLKDKIEFVYGVGGYHKAGSSSQYLRNWVNNTMERYNIDFRLNKKY